MQNLNRPKKFLLALLEVLFGKRACSVIPTLKTVLPPVIAMVS